MVQIVGGSWGSCPCFPAESSRWQYPQTSERPWDMGSLCNCLEKLRANIAQVLFKVPIWVNSISQLYLEDNIFIPDIVQPRGLCTSTLLLLGAGYPCNIHATDFWSLTLRQQRRLLWQLFKIFCITLYAFYAAFLYIASSPCALSSFWNLNHRSFFWFVYDCIHSSSHKTQEIQLYTYQMMTSVWKKSSYREFKQIVHICMSHLHKQACNLDSAVLEPQL